MKLLASPWIGEFGWEVCWWVPYLRYMAWKNRLKDVVIGCREGHEFLYKDFASESISVKADGMASEYFLNNQDPRWGYDILQKYNDHTVVSPSREIKHTNNLFYKIYHNGQPNEYFDAIIHARSTKKLGTEYRNWPIDNWQTVIGEFASKKIACVGSLSESAYIPNTTDLRGIPLDSLVKYLSYAKVTMGCSSGLMHLASMCCCPHVVWTAKNRHGTIRGDNRYRYQDVWNPFNTRVNVIDHQGWQPDTETVIGETQKIINTPRRYRKQHSKGSGVSRKRRRGGILPVMVAMTTMDRTEYFNRTIESLKHTNVSLEDLLVFDDHSTDPKKISKLRELNIKHHVIHNPRQYGAWVNARMAMDLAYNLTQNKYFVYTQDDVEFSLDWHARLDSIIKKIEVTGTDWGMLSLWHCYGETDEDYYTLNESHSGAVCLAINKVMWKVYRENNDIYHNDSKRGRALLDFRLAHWCRNNPIQQFAVCYTGKSLVNHIGAESTLCGKDMSVFKALGFNKQ